MPQQTGGTLPVELTLIQAPQVAPIAVHQVYRQINQTGVKLKEDGVINVDGVERDQAKGCCGVGRRKEAKLPTGDNEERSEKVGVLFQWLLAVLKVTGYASSPPNGEHVPVEKGLPGEPTGVLWMPPVAPVASGKLPICRQKGHHLTPVNSGPVALEPSEKCQQKKE